MRKDFRVSGYRLIFGYLGVFLFFVGIITLLPLLLLIFYPNEYNVTLSFAIPGVISIIVGLILWQLLIARKERQQLAKFQDSILLVSLYILSILVGAIPFMLRGIFSDGAGNLSFLDALFESTSGYTATGLTVFLFSEDLPGYHLFTMYRSLLLLCGGVGLVLIVTSAISDRYGLKLYTAEGHNDKLMPNLAKSARLILLIYVGYILLGTLSYFLIGGMELFDAFNHSIAAVATGGFSTKEGGIPEIIEQGGVNSLTGIPINGIAINITSIVLMVLGSTNFVIHLFLFKGKIKKIIKDCEVRFFLLMCLIFIPLFCISIYFDNTTPTHLWANLFDGTYLFFSTITTTGFMTVNQITSFGQGVLLLSIIMMIVGGALGSTAGGVKQFRIYLAFKSLYWGIRDRLSPKSKVYPHMVNHLGETREVKKDEIYEAHGYFLLYVLVMLFGGIIISVMANGYGDFYASNCIFEFVSALSGTGLSVGITGNVLLPTFNNVIIKIVLIIGMFAGRLEISCIYFAFYRGVRDVLRKETV